MTISFPAPEGVIITLHIIEMCGNGVHLNRRVGNGHRVAVKQSEVVERRCRKRKL